MNESINGVDRSLQIEKELNRWKEYQLDGESLGDPSMVLTGLSRQVGCLYDLNRTDEARLVLK